MSRISHDAMVQAITQVRAMDSNQKEGLADEIFRIQPHLFGSFLVQSRLGVSLEKMEFLLNILCISFQAMKASGLAWPLITEDDLDRQSQRFVAIVKFGYDLSESLRHQSMQHYVADHPEKDLLAYVQLETANWLKRIAPEETDKYVLLAVWNIVNCVAYVPLKSHKISAQGAQ
jgi:hypothetical protein